MELPQMKEQVDAKAEARARLVADLSGLLAEAKEAKDFVAAAQIAAAIHLGPSMLRGETPATSALTEEMLEVFRGIVVTTIKGLGANEHDLYMTNGNARIAKAISQFTAALLQMFEGLRFGPKPNIQVVSPAGQPLPAGG